MWPTEMRYGKISSSQKTPKRSFCGMFFLKQRNMIEFDATRDATKMTTDFSVISSRDFTAATDAAPESCKRPALRRCKDRRGLHQHGNPRRKRDDLNVDVAGVLPPGQLSRRPVQFCFKNSHQ